MDPFPLLSGADLRGSNYARVMADRSPALKARAQEIIEATGKLTPRNIAALTVFIGLPLKTTVQFLEYCEVLPSGTWERKIEGSKVEKEMRQLLEGDHHATRIQPIN